MLTQSKVYGIPKSLTQAQPKPNPANAQSAVPYQPHNYYYRIAQLLQPAHTW